MDNNIFVGNKEINRYITNALILKNSGSEAIILKARGKLIKKAVDISQILLRQYFPDASMEVDLDTDQVYRRDQPDEQINVSSIAITIIF